MDHILTALSRLPNTRHAFSASPTKSIVVAPREKLRQEQAAEAKRAYFDAIRQTVAFQCDTCRDALLVETLPGSGVFRPCPDCSGPRQAARLQSICGMNEAEMRYSLDDLATTGGDTDRMVIAARVFIANPVGILTLHGGSGNAKTVVLMAVVNECLRRGVSALYTTFFDLVGYVREAYRNDSESAWQRVRRFQSIRVLCIDEFDKVKATESVEELETAIVDRRYRDGLAGMVGTMLAMNDDPSSLPIWIFSRMHDGRNKIVGNADDDMRPMLR